MSMRTLINEAKKAQTALRAAESYFRGDQCLRNYLLIVSHRAFLAGIYQAMAVEAPSAAQAMRHPDEWLRERGEDLFKSRGN